MSSNYDIEFFWDPVCPFAWITSRWVEKVSAQTGYQIDWRLISLRLLNKAKDYATEFPPDYEFFHTAGLRMLRVAAKVRAECGRAHMGPLYTGYGNAYWEQEKGSGMRRRLGTVAHIAEVLEAVGLSPAFAAAADDDSWDTEIDAETELGLSRTGRDVGTPIITFEPPGGLSFFGPVISRVPSDAEAVELWNAVITLAKFPGFAEMKRSLREVPQLRILGSLSDAPESEDWQGGHRANALPPKQSSLDKG
jgi:2-hydroxychromene-2-carboxylate isomerase